jgi:hypothetical protein
MLCHTNRGLMMDCVVNTCCCVEMVFCVHGNIVNIVIKLKVATQL